MNEPKNMFLATALVVLLAKAGLVWSNPLSEKVSHLPSHIPAEYQNTISKVLPGYEILRNEDMAQDESQLRNFLSPDEITKRKGREPLGFIVGRFNNDRSPDFAAWVINRSVKQERPAMPTSYHWDEHFAARLVVCLGTSTPQEYHCEILPIMDVNFISLPYWAELEVFKIRSEIQCGDQDIAITAFYPEGWKGKRPNSGRDELPARKLLPNYDAIGEYAIGSNAGRTLIRQSDGVYLDCAGAD